MQVIMKKLLANHKGVFLPGEKYEASDASCMALIAEGYAFDVIGDGPDVEPWNGDPNEEEVKEEAEEVETAEAEPVREVAAKRTRKKRGRPRKK